MEEQSTLLDALVTQLRQAGQYNRNDQQGPVTVLWPDRRQQWESLLPLLRDELPVLILGDYRPNLRMGPAYWLRCMLGRTLEEDKLPEDEIPVVYLPGYGKNDLRAIEVCPKPLRPLAELQYRGTVWVHRNGRDWTVAGFLHHLGVVVSADNETKDALIRSLPRLAFESVNRLRQHAPLDAKFLNRLLHPDTVRQMLLWMSNPDGFREQLKDDEWAAFCALSRQKYGVDPNIDGVISAAQRLSDTSGDWATVWKRYVEAPKEYPGIPDLLTQASPSQLSLLEPSPVWPQSNQAAEDRLRDSLVQLHSKLPSEIRCILEKLEKQHAPRRQWVWAELNMAPLAEAMKYLTELAHLTNRPLGGSDISAIAQNYTSWGWKADSAVLNALAVVQNQNDVHAIQGVVRTLYGKWLQETCQNMQQTIMSNPSETYSVSAPPIGESGTCILFSDALRYDIGRRLLAKLNCTEVNCTIDWQLSALPTVTSTAKPAISPVAGKIIGGQELELTPMVSRTGTKVTASSLRNLIQDAGWQVLGQDELGDPIGCAWTEIGEIYSNVHGYGWKTSHRIPDEIQVLIDRIESLLQHGWKEIYVVTDHGWLMLPGGLPKADLPIHLTTTRKGRCAVLKEGAATNQLTVPWHWHSKVRIALAPGMYCFEAGKEYEHGGVSPQECIVPIIIIKS